MHVLFFYNLSNEENPMITSFSQPYTYKATLEAAHKVTWRIEDIIGGDKCLDFTKSFLPG
jgi:hypothetical protein